MEVARIKLSKLSNSNEGNREGSGGVGSEEKKTETGGDVTRGRPG